VSLADRGAKLLASQLGQVVHPSPEPVSRTAAPVTTMNTSDASVTTASTR